MSPRMTAIPCPPGERPARPGARRPAARAQRDGGAVVHLSAVAEDVPRVAAAAWALAETNAFGQLVLDVSDEGGAAVALAELGVTVPVRRVAPAHGTLPDALRAELAPTGCLALILHSDGAAALAGGLAAARLGVSLVRVGSTTPGRTAEGAARAVGRLADLLLVHGCDDPAIVAPERVHVIGNPLIDAVRRYSREAVARAAWRRHELDRGRYVLALLTGPPAPELAAPLAALAAEAPLVIGAPAHWHALLAPACAAGARFAAAPGFVERLSLERAAGAIVTDSARVQEEAASLGIRCHALGEPAGRVRADAGGTTVALGADPWALTRVRPDPNPPTPCMIPLWDARAGARLADVLVANFALVRLV